MLNFGLTTELNVASYCTGSISPYMSQCDREMGHFYCAKDVVQSTLRKRDNCSVHVESLHQAFLVFQMSFRWLETVLKHTPSLETSFRTAVSGLNSIDALTFSFLVTQSRSRPGSPSKLAFSPRNF